MHTNKPILNTEPTLNKSVHTSFKYWLTCFNLLEVDLRNEVLLAYNPTMHKNLYNIKH